MFCKTLISEIQKYQKIAFIYIFLLVYLQRLLLQQQQQQQQKAQSQRAMPVGRPTEQVCV